jgi:hypothetical protein
MNSLINAQAVAAAIRVMAPGVSQIIGVDGFMQSGKTTLAFKLAEQLNGIRIGLDCYANGYREVSSYVEKLRLPYLQSDINKLTSNFQFVIVDGVCLLDALDAISVRPNLTVYVKRVSGQGLWHDGFHLEDYVADPKSVTDWLEACIYAYHSNRRPHELTNLTYERREA